MSPLADGRLLQAGSKSSTARRRMTPSELDWALLFLQPDCDASRGKDRLQFPIGVTKFAADLR
jgi:hypothetical protein